jgi:hypothetical protein
VIFFRVATVSSTVSTRAFAAPMTFGFLGTVGLSRVKVVGVNLPE